MSTLESHFRRGFQVAVIDTSCQMVQSVLDNLQENFKNSEPTHKDLGLFFRLLFTIYPLKIPMSDMTYRHALNWRDHLAISVLSPHNDDIISSLLQRIDPTELDTVILGSGEQKTKRFLWRNKQSISELEHNVTGILKWIFKVVSMNPHYCLFVTHLLLGTSDTCSAGGRVFFSV
jgi:hypothetical protein